MQKRNPNSLSLLFAFLLTNSLGKQAVSTYSINQRVEIALLLLCVCFKDKQSVLLKISRKSLLLFYKMDEYCTLLKIKLIYSPAGL